MTTLQVIKSVPLSRKEMVQMVMVETRFGPQYQVQYLALNQSSNQWIKSCELLAPTNKATAEGYFFQQISKYLHDFSESDLTNSPYVGGKSL